MSQPQYVNSQAQANDITPFPRSLILGGLSILFIFLLSLSAWSALAPIEGAIVSPGIISVSSHRKQIQHLEGGIVEAIHVTDGDEVKKGQLLLDLRNVTADAELRRLHGRHTEVRAVIARLEAEEAGKDKLEFPEELLKAQDDTVTQSLLSRQTSIFNNNQSLVRDQLAVYEKKIGQAQEEIDGLKGRIKYKRQEAKLLEAQLNNIKLAVEKGLIPKAEELKLGQKYALLKGDLIGLKSEQGRLQKLILETRVQQKETQAQWQSDLSEQIRSQESLLFDLNQQIVKAQDVMDRTRIISPIDGVVVNMQVHSRDGVIDSGQLLMEIVPSNDELIVDVFLDPEDINDISVGMPADVRLTSVSRRQRIPMEGVISRISADRLTNPQTGKDYYSARVSLSPSVTDQQHLSLVPGMGADVFIRTGARTPFDYLLSPIADSLQFALREN
ncbi:MAG: HlyD family type I secretion periplasmic adaptor subunit [Chromatiales bacterium]|jgi:HlyD family type I secretion membrane fusion protein